MRTILEIFFDGGCRGNPGPGSVGVHCRLRKPNAKTPIVAWNYSAFIGHVTNNVAEFTACRLALNVALDAAQRKLHVATPIEKPVPFSEDIALAQKTLGDASPAFICVHGDSKLAINGTQKLWKIKAPSIAKLATECEFLWKRLQRGGAHSSICHVPRKRNTDADAAANRALDRAERKPPV